jgi:Zn-dependent protease
MITTLLQLFLLMFISSIIHEAGHALFGKLFGLQLAQFQIFGGDAVLRYKAFAIGYIPMVSWVVFKYHGKILGRTKKIMLAAGGCIFQLAAALLLMYAGLFKWLYSYMLVMCLVNLIPFKNSDGHQILRMLLRKK